MAVDGEETDGGHEHETPSACPNLGVSGASAGATTGTNAATSNKDAQPPAKRYRLTDAMKALVWKLVLVSNELENEKK